MNMTTTKIVRNLCIVACVLCIATFCVTQLGGCKGGIGAFMDDQPGVTTASDSAKPGEGKAPVDTAIQIGEAVKDVAPFPFDLVGGAIVAALAAATAHYRAQKKGEDKGWDEAVSSGVTVTRQTTTTGFAADAKPVA